MRQSLVGSSKQLKQIIQIKHCKESQLAVGKPVGYKRGRGFEIGVTVKQIKRMVRVGLDPGTARLRVRRADG